MVSFFGREAMRLVIVVILQSLNLACESMIFSLSDIVNHPYITLSTMWSMIAVLVLTVLVMMIVLVVTHFVFSFYLKRCCCVRLSGKAQTFSLNIFYHGIVFLKMNASNAQAVPISYYKWSFFGVLCSCRKNYPEKKRLFPFIFSPWKIYNFMV